MYSTTMQNDSSDSEEEYQIPRTKTWQEKRDEQIQTLDKWRNLQVSDPQTINNNTFINDIKAPLIDAFKKQHYPVKDQNYEIPSAQLKLYNRSLEQAREDVDRYANLYLGLQALATTDIKQDFDNFNNDNDDALEGHKDMAYLDACSTVINGQGLFYVWQGNAIKKINQTPYDPEGLGLEIYKGLEEQLQVSLTVASNYWKANFVTSSPVKVTAQSRAHGDLSSSAKAGGNEVFGSTGIGVGIVNYREGFEEPVAVDHYMGTSFGKGFGEKPSKYDIPEDTVSGKKVSELDILSHDQYARYLDTVKAVGKDRTSGAVNEHGLKVRNGRGSGQSAAMGRTSANQLAKYLGIDGGRAWEWLHIRADSLGGETTPFNLVLGTKDQNTAMMPFEASLKSLASLARKDEAKSVMAEFSTSGDLLSDIPCTEENINMNWYMSWNKEQVAENEVKTQEYSGTITFMPRKTSYVAAKDDIKLLEEQLTAQSNKFRSEEE